MRLLFRDDSGALKFLENANEQEYDTSYAILSHTWGKDEEEVLYQDVGQCVALTKIGYAKIEFTLDQAKLDGYQYVWIDTCCINRWNATELGEAINLMYEWYAHAGICYAYLSDIVVNGNLAFSDSRWFSRGWTLQELVAPRALHFYGSDAQFLGNKSGMSQLLHDITGIPQRILCGEPKELATVVQRFRWSLKRTTRKPEDASWSLAGLLGVSVQLQYGIGRNAALDRLLQQVKEVYGGNTVKDIERSILQQVPAPSLGVPVDRKSTESISNMKKLLQFSEMYTRRLVIEHALSGTSEWVFDTTELEEWVNSANPNNFLWIKGHPGAGKSTIMKYLDLKFEALSTTDTIQASFYFNARGTDLEKTTTGMYRSLIGQILDHVPTAVAQDICFDAFKIMPRTEQDTTIFWLKDLFKITVERCAQHHVRCFIDALDECNLAEVQDMVVFLKDVGKAIAPKQRFSVCFASRYYPALTIKDSIQLRLELQDQHKRDIEFYVNERLDVTDLPDGENIKRQLIDRASGIFMWAVLVVKSVNQEIADGAVNNIPHVIEDLPQGLAGLYRALAKRQDSKTASSFRLCMQLVLFCCRPLYPDELLCAMLDHPLNNDQYVPSSLVKAAAELSGNDCGNFKIAQKFVSCSSRGLAEIVRGGPGEEDVEFEHRHDRVQVIHESVRDFFLSHEGLSLLAGLSRASNEHLVSSCDDQIKWVCFRHLFSEQSPFNDYAFKNVERHAEQAALHISQDSFILSLDDAFSHKGQRSTELLLRLPRTTRRYTAIHVFAYLGCPRLISAAARLGYDLDMEDDSLRTPMAIAAAMRPPRWDVMHTLLVCGAGLPDFVQIIRNAREGGVRRHLVEILCPPNAKIREPYSSQTGPSNVLISFEHGGLAAAVRLFLAYGLDTTYQDPSGCTVLMELCSRCVHNPTNPFGFATKSERGSNELAAVAFLLSHGAHMDKAMHLADEVGNTALHICTYSIPTNVKLLALLLQHGARVDQRCHSGQTTLMHACDKTDQPAVELLLDYHASTNIKDKDGRVALHYATGPHRTCSLQDGVCLHATVTALLLEHGAFPAIVDKSGKTPLDLALERQDRCGAKMASKLRHHTKQDSRRHKRPLSSVD